MPDGATLIEAESTRCVRLMIYRNAATLKEIRGRRATRHAHDGDAVRQGACDGLVSRSAGVVRPGTGFARATDIIAARDIANVKALLAGAGADGPVPNLVARTGSISRTIAPIIRASLGEAGISVEIRLTEDAADFAPGDETAGDDHLSQEPVLQSFACGVDPTGTLVRCRPDEIGVHGWAFFDSAEREDIDQRSLTGRPPGRRRAMVNRSAQPMQQSGSFVVIRFAPLAAIHDAGRGPVNLADGHPDPVRSIKA